jgi:hypothetical protein
MVTGIEILTLINKKITTSLSLLTTTRRFNSKER